jgi:hypothetical protein
MIKDWRNCGGPIVGSGPEIRKSMKILTRELLHLLTRRIVRTGSQGYNYIELHMRDCGLRRIRADILSLPIKTILLDSLPSDSSRIGAFYLILMLFEILSQLPQLLYYQFSYQRILRLLRTPKEFLPIKQVPFIADPPLLTPRKQPIEISTHPLETPSHRFPVLCDILKIAIRMAHECLPQILKAVFHMVIIRVCTDSIEVKIG